MTSAAPVPPNDGEYARKLALAILSTLQTKGLLTSQEVDSILLGARRAAEAASQKAARSTQTSTLPQPPRATQATAVPAAQAGWVVAAGTESVVPATHIAQAKVVAEVKGFTPLVRPPAAPAPVPPVAEVSAAPQAEPVATKAPAEQPKTATPPVIDFQLD